MHVAYIHQHFSSRRGSWGTRSYEFSMRLIRAGHRVTLIKGMGSRTGVEHDSDQRIMETDINGIRVVSVAEPYDNTMGFVRRWIAFTRFARTAGEIVCRSNADLVFATSTPLTVGIPGMKSAKRLGVPFVFEVRDLWPELPIAMGIVRNPLIAWYLRRMERRIYQAATRIIALADEHESHARLAPPLDLRHGIEHRLQPVGQTVGTGEHETKIICRSETRIIQRFVARFE